MITDGQIPVDSEEGKELGFTSDIYEPCSFLWKMGSDIYVSIIITKSGQRRKGHFTSLINKIHSFGLGVKVPTPLAQMDVVLRKKGFLQSWEFDMVSQCDIEVWTLLAPKTRNHSSS